MTTKILSYGTLPSREEFEAAFDARAELHPARKLASVGAVFSFHDDPRVGTCALTCSELWEELVKAQEEWAGSCGVDSCACEDGLAGQWCSDVLGILGFE